MNLRTYVSDVFLDFPNALTRTTLASEERDIARIALRIVGTNQAQEGGFTRPVIARQGPLLPFPNYPIKLFQDSPLIVTNTYFIEADYFGYLVFSPFLILRSTIPLVILRSVATKDLGSINFRYTIEILRFHLFPTHQSLHRHHMRNERRNILGTRKQENDMQMRFLYQFAEQVLKQGTCRSIEPDERIVQYQKAGFAHKRLGELELAELPARKQHDVLVEHIVHPEKTEQGFLESLILSLGQKFAHQWSNLPVLRMIALLIIVSSVRIAIRIAEGYVFDMVAHQIRPGFVKMILHLVHQQGPASGDDVHQ